MLKIGNLVDRLSKIGFLKKRIKEPVDSENKVQCFEIVLIFKNRKINIKLKIDTLDPDKSIPIIGIIDKYFIFVIFFIFAKNNNPVVNIKYCPIKFGISKVAYGRPSK